MTTEAIQTIKVYGRDVERMTRMYGAPQWRAFHLALAKAPCEHPEGKRQYTTAFMRADGQAFNQMEFDREEILTLSGFRCMACGSYVFPAGNDEKA